MNLVALLQVLLSFADKLASYLHTKQLMDAGAAQAALAGIRAAQKEVERAEQIRQGVRAELAADPGKLRERDRFSRD